MTVPEVSVVIVSYNGEDWLDRCLRALMDEASPRRSFEVIVLDNLSAAPARELLQMWADRVTVVFSDENLGFGRGCNLAVQHAVGERILLLNPDAVVGPGCVDALADFLDARPGAGLVGGRTIRPDGRVDPSSCWGMPTLWSTFCFATGLSTAFKRSPVFDPESMGRWERDSVREVGIVTGCLLMTRRTTWDLLGGFDEDYFMYGEDADLSRRAAEGGFRPAITPAAVAVHAVGISSGHKPQKNRLLMTGKATLLRKSWPGARAAVGVGLLHVGVAIRGLGEVLRREPDAAWLPLVRDHSWVRGWPARPQG